MRSDARSIASTVRRAVRVGGFSKCQLLSELQRHSIELNELARVLFAHEAFTTLEQSSVIETIELSVRDLGLPDGGSIAQIQQASAIHGLSMCPVELGPHLRLQLLDQPESHGQTPSQHRAPPGSITVASRELTDDETVPKGFYLRRIEGVLWLRAYCSGPEHVWSPEDRFVFCQNAA